MRESDYDEDGFNETAGSDRSDRIGWNRGLVEMSMVRMVSFVVDVGTNGDGLSWIGWKNLTVSRHVERIAVRDRKQRDGDGKELKEKKRKESNRRGEWELEWNGRIILP